MAQLTRTRTMHFTMIAIAVIQSGQSQIPNATANATKHLESFEFDLTSGANCAATIRKELQPNYTNHYTSYQYQFINGSCENPTLWYSYYPIYYDGSSIFHTFSRIYGDDYGINISCDTNAPCLQHDFCASNYNLATQNYSHKTAIATSFAFQTFQTEYTSTNQCPEPTTSSTNFPSFMTVLCGHYNFTSNITQQEFLEKLSSGAIPQCGNKANPYEEVIRTTASSSTTSTDINVDSDDEVEPFCIIYSDDNWMNWVYLAVAFMVVSVVMFFAMTRGAGIEISINKWGAILLLFMSSLAIASILQALTTTFVVMATYDKCNTLQSQAPYTPWQWEEDWEKDSLMGFWFWIIGVILSSAVYFFILMMKFEIRSVSQYQYGLVKNCGEKCMGWCVKGVFFIVSFSFSAILRPYYMIGEHSELGNQCACVDDGIALIAEIYGAALLSVLLGPFAVYCGKKCVAVEDDEDPDSKGEWFVRLIGCLLVLYGAYCAFIVIAAPFLFVGCRVVEYMESAEELFTSDDFIMFIWFFEGISNFFK